jgi:hypothetical protein
MTQLFRSGRTGSHALYVMPADVLSAEPIDGGDMSSLRADGSHNGVCYLAVIRPLHDGTSLVRIAAHPDRILTQGYTVVLSEAELAKAQPWDGCFQVV